MKTMTKEMFKALSINEKLDLIIDELGLVKISDPTIQAATISASGGSYKKIKPTEETQKYAPFNTFISL